jgi:PTS system nitrogen regulatory IIA component
MDWQTLLKPESVRVGIAARSKKHSLDIVSGLLAKSASVPLSEAEVFDALVGRERLGCTGLGQGVAIPHGRIGGIETCVGALIRLGEPVDFDTPDGEPVDLIFGLLVPADCDTCSTDELKALATMLSDPLLRRRLREAPDAPTIHGLLTGEPAKRRATA